MMNWQRREDEDDPFVPEEPAPPPAPRWPRRLPHRPTYSVWFADGVYYLSCDDPSEGGPTERDVPAYAEHVTTIRALSWRHAAEAIAGIDGVTLAGWSKPAGKPPGIDDLL